MCSNTLDVMLEELTLVPIPKNKRGNKSDLTNYRAIAISSLLGKRFDIIVLNKQCKSR